MSKRDNFQQGRKQQRRREEGSEEAWTRKMLGKQARMNYGSGASRLPAKVVQSLLREAAEEQVTQ